MTAFEAYEKPANFSQVRQSVEIRVGSGPVNLTLTSPYFKEIADRNLILHSVEFLPSTKK